MAEQRQNRCDAKLQQGEESDIQLRHVAQLHQRGFAGFDPLTTQATGQIIRRLVQFAIAQVSIAINHRRFIAVCVAADPASTLFHDSGGQTPPANG